MSYRDKLNAGKEARIKIKNTVGLSVKITVIVLAALVLLATVLVVMDMVGDNGGTIGGGSSGGVDREPPVIKLKSGDAIFVMVGEQVTWRDKVSVTDDSGNVTLKFDAEKINTDIEGTYRITYTATDAKGNVTEKTFPVVIKRAEYSYNQMESLIKKKAESLGITSSMSKKEIVKAVYNYVNSPDKTPEKANFVFENESNIPNIDRDNWESDWVEETVRALASGEGDCYTYYSVSKAFFEVFGIENVGIQRDFTSEKDGTHFWLMVNIGDSSTPQWYYYDATRLAGQFEDGTRNACLITLAKLQSYQPTKSGIQLYIFDPSKHPTASTAEVK